MSLGEAAATGSDCLIVLGKVIILFPFRCRFVSITVSALLSFTFHSFIVLSTHIMSVHTTLGTVGRQQTHRIAGPPNPRHTIDPLINLQTLQIIKLGFVRLELGVEFVLAALLLLRVVNVNTV